MSCLGRGSMYFTDEHNRIPCYGKIIHLRKFWLHSPNGNLDAEVCRLHAGLFVRKNPIRKLSYLTERIAESISQADRGCC